MVLIGIALLLCVSSAGCSPGPMTLALAGRPERMQFGFPGRCCALSQVRLEALGDTREQDTVVWQIVALSPDAKVPFPLVLGTVPLGYRETVPFNPADFAQLAERDTHMAFYSDAGGTASFRASELSATGAVVQIADSRSVTEFSDMQAYRASYLRDQAKDERGKNRVVFVLWPVVLFGCVAAIVSQVRHQRRRRRGRVGV
jgi:hypothetical protein